MGILSREQIDKIGFLKVGDCVQISDCASIYNAKNISIGNNVRIDDFCVLSAGVGGIEIGDFIHLSIGVSLIGGGKITLSNFVALSSRVSVYSSNDDYSGEFMTNPTVPSKFTNVMIGDVFIGKHVIVGSGSVVLPNVTIAQGAAIGSLSLVNKDCEAFGIYVGSPAKFVKKRSDNLLNLEKILLSE